MLPSPPERLLLNDAPPKGPIVKLLRDVKLLPPKPNETLTGVKLDKQGQVICAKYTTGTPHPTFEGVHAHPAKVKFILPKKIPKRAPPPSQEQGWKHHRTTVADLEQKVEFLWKLVKTVEESHHILARTVLTTNQRVDLAETERKKLAT
jgi:hypothetical protein